jgi:DNA-binding transcriptional LysR family regulator
MENRRFVVAPSAFVGTGVRPLQNREVASPLHITLRQLRAFAEAYRLRNLTHAADALHMTQSAMSALIRQLEDSLGVRLFDRTPRTLRPTKAADEAYPQAEAILSRVGSLQTSMQDKAKDADSVLAFSCVPALASSVVPPVLAKFRQAMPKVRTVMFDEGDSALIERVLSGECEFSVSSFAHDPEAVAQIPLVADSLRVVFGKSSPLASHKRVTWADLVDQPIINLSKGSTLQHLIREFFPDSGRAYKPAYDIGFIHTALAMASEGLGVVILPGYLVKGNPHGRGLVVKQLHEPVVEQSLIIHTRKGHVLSGPAREFLQMLREHLEELA